MKKDFIVYKESNKFAAWPAGYICESWGEEILASYLVCDYLNAERGHHFIRENPWYVYTSRSTDNGKTWSAPQMLNHQVKGSSNTYYLVSPGRGFYDVNTGAIVFGAYDNNAQASMIFSLDGGNTWKRTANVNGTSSENEIVQLEGLEADEEDIAKALAVICRQNDMTMEQLKPYYDAEFEKAVVRSVLSTKVTKLIRDAAIITETA